MNADVYQFLKTQIETLGVNAFLEFLPDDSNNTPNSCAIRTLPVETINYLCGPGYYDGTINLLYRGPENRLEALNKANAIQELLNDTNNVVTNNTDIAYIRADKPILGYVDESKQPHYSINLGIIYNE